MPNVSVLVQQEQDERVRLQVIEGRIESNLRRMGNLWKNILEDLAEIDAQQLWRFSHDSFQDYWSDRFQKTVFADLFLADGSSQRYQQYRMKALKAAVDIMPAGHQYVPENEAQARELTGLESPEAKQQASKVAHDLSESPTAQHYARGASSTACPEDEFSVGDRVYSTNAKSPHFGGAFQVVETGAGKSKSLVMAVPESGGSTIPFARGELSPEPTATLPERTIVRSNVTTSTLPDRLSYCDAQLSATHGWLIKIMTTCSLVLMTDGDDAAHTEALDELHDRIQEVSEWLGVDVAA